MPWCPAASTRSSSHVRCRPPSLCPAWACAGPRPPARRLHAAPALHAPPVPLTAQRRSGSSLAARAAAQPVCHSPKLPTPALCSRRPGERKRCQQPAMPRHAAAPAVPPPGPAKGGLQGPSRASAEQVGASAGAAPIMGQLAPPHGAACHDCRCLMVLLVQPTNRITRIPPLPRRSSPSSAAGLSLWAPSSTAAIQRTRLSATTSNVTHIVRLPCRGYGQ